MARELAARSPARRVLGITVEELLFGAGWVHALAGGTAVTSIAFSDGSVLESRSLAAVFNRVRYVTAPPFAAAPDREYAVMESYALLLSWLASVPCPVLDPATPRGLSGSAMTPLEWMALAASESIPIRGWLVTTSGRRYGRRGVEWIDPPAPMTSGDPDDAETGSTLPPGDRPAMYRDRAGSTRRRIVVAGGSVSGAPTADWSDRARRMARASASPLLELGVVSAADGEGPDGGWLLERVDPWVECVTHGEVEQIAQALEDAANAWPAWPPG